MSRKRQEKGVNVSEFSKRTRFLTTAGYAESQITTLAALRGRNFLTQRERIDVLRVYFALLGGSEGNTVLTLLIELLFYSVEAKIQLKLFSRSGKSLT